jgi:carbon-monoxide dehydrogenase medium subunit
MRCLFRLRILSLAASVVHGVFKEGAIKPAAFDYERPDSLAEALSLMEQHGFDATLIAGGQSLVPMMALRLARPGVLVDLNRIAELGGVSDNGALRVGAMTRQAQILTDPIVAEKLPVFQDVTRYVGHLQTRSRGTVGGSLSLSDPAAEYPAFALAMDAEVELQTASETRRVAMSDFIIGPYMTALEPEEIMVAVHIPLPGKSSFVVIDEIYRRPGDFALVGLVARLEMAGEKISEARLSWLGVGSSAVRSVQTESAMVGRALGELDFMEVGASAMAELDLKTDLQATAEYRASAGRNLAARTLATLSNRISAA